MASTIVMELCFLLDKDKQTTTNSGKPTSATISRNPPIASASINANCERANTPAKIECKPSFDVSDSGFIPKKQLAAVIRLPIASS